MILVNKNYLKVVKVQLLVSAREHSSRRSLAPLIGRRRSVTACTLVRQSSTATSLSSCSSTCYLQITSYLICFTMQACVLMSCKTACRAGFARCAGEGAPRLAH